MLSGKVKEGRCYQGRLRGEELPGKVDEGLEVLPFKCMLIKRRLNIVRRVGTKPSLT